MLASQCAGTYVSILICWHICRHLNMSAYSSAFQKCVHHMSAYFPQLEEYVGISMCRHLCQHLNIWHICRRLNMSAYLSPLIECAEISMCWHICQHPDVSAYMSASRHVNILTITRTNVLTYMSAYLSPLVECADISICWHMSASWCVDIYVGIWTCQHIG